MDYIVYIAIAVLAVLGTLYLTKTIDKKTFNQGLNLLTEQIKLSQEKQKALKEDKKKLTESLEKMKEDIEKDGGYQDTLEEFEKKYRQK